MKQLTLFLLISATTTCSLAADGKPNVLFIISDDLNTALSGLGHPECKTPNLDRFAASGVTFTKAYCQFPLCAPSRASLMTGQYPLTNGVVGNGGHVKEERITLPRHFAYHGYWTARVSKIYHMGIPIDIVQGTSGRDHAPSWMHAQNIAALETLTPGTIENFTHPEAVASYPASREKWLAAQASGKPYSMPREVRGDYAVLEVEDHNAHLLPDTMTADKAISLLNERSAQTDPFFLAVGFVRPHFPFVSTASTIAPYDADQLAAPQQVEGDLNDIPKQAINAQMDFEDDETRRLRRGYYGAISFMDQQVGRLLAELDRLKLRDNTIVVFVSDHGYLTGEHHMWKKSKLFEEAIRVPLIISAPGKDRDTRTNRFVELVDLYPTLSELAGLSADPGAQGQSLVPLLSDPKATLPRTDAFIQTATGFGLRSGKWAYMWYPASKKHKQAGFMLYNMKQDPQQFTNLATNSDLKATKNKLHKRLMARIQAAKPPESARDKKQ